MKNFYWQVILVICAILSVGNCVTSTLSSSIYMNNNTPAGNNLHFHWQLYKGADGKFEKVRIGIDRRVSDENVAVGWGHNMYKGVTIYVGFDSLGNLALNECEMVGQISPKCFALTGWTIISATKNNPGYYVELERTLS